MAVARGGAAVARHSLAAGSRRVLLRCEPSFHDRMGEAQREVRVKSGLCDRSALLALLKIAALR
jgi:hypothetical protein